MNKEALTLALEALEDAHYFIEAELNDRMDLYKNYPNLAHKYAGEQESLRKNQEAITAIKEALAQPEQEPVGQLLEDAFGRGQVMWFNKPEDESLLYTTPPQRKPLTDEQIREASLKAGMQEHYMGFHSGFISFARAIEAAHGIKE